jgi:hypothetical protein
VQAEHEHAAFRLGAVQRLRERHAAAFRLEHILERPLVAEQLRRRHLMHGVGDVPEPQVGLRQRLAQRLRRGDGYEPFLVGAAEENSVAHLTSRSSFRGDAQHRTRNLVAQPTSRFRIRATRAPE